ncbi:MAG: SGNH/GDSL hydrolase family protein [archaeon]
MTGKGIHKGKYFPIIASALLALMIIKAYSAAIPDHRYVILPDTFSITPRFAPNSTSTMSRHLTGGEAEVRINSRGFRDSEHQSEKDPGNTRILLAGDSFVFGLWLEANETIGRFLENQSPDVEVISLGMPGANTKKIVSLILEQGLSYNPDVIIIQYNIGSDWIPEEKIAFSDPAMRIFRIIQLIDVKAGYQIYHSLLMNRYRALVFNDADFKNGVAAPLKQLAGADIPVILLLYYDNGSPESWRIKTLASELGFRTVTTKNIWNTHPRESLELPDEHPTPLANALVAKELHSAIYFLGR